MRYIIVGLGNIGKKRKALINDSCIATVDPFNKDATYRHYKDVPLSDFDAAFLSVPNEIKLELMEYFLISKKHILIDKPVLFANKAEADMYYNLANNNNTIWHTSYNHRFEEYIIKLKELLDNNVIGEIYHAKMLYGNGTVQNSIGTWREKGNGVIEDLGCHLIDLTHYLFNYQNPYYHLWKSDIIESNNIDHAIFSTFDKKITLECSNTIWKNSFTIDIYGKLGSLHMNGLCKWGYSELIIRNRIFPSGKPTETILTTKQEDMSWLEDIKYFEKQILLNKNDYENDLYVSLSLHELIKQSKTI